MKIEDNATGLTANFKYEDGEPCGPPSYNGKHLGFLFESVVYHYLLHASEGWAVSTYYLSKEMRAICDVVMMRGDKPICYLEVKSRRAIDGSFNPDYLKSEYKKNLSALRELDEPFALVVGQYQDEVNTVVKDLAYFDEERCIYTEPPLECVHEAVMLVADRYKFYVYVGYGELGGWLDLSSVEKPFAEIANITDPEYAQCPLIEIAEALSAHAGMRGYKGDSVLSLQEYKRFLLPSANVEPEPKALSSEMLEPEAPSPIEVLEAKIAKHRQSARRHHQEAEDLNDSLLKATSNQIIEAFFSEMGSVSKHFESIGESISTLETKFDTLDYSVGGQIERINNVTSESKIIWAIVNKHLCDSAPHKEFDDRLKEFDDRLKELSERLTNFECDLLLMKKSHLSNEKREHKNRELIDHLYAQLGEDQDG